MKLVFADYVTCFKNCFNQNFCAKVWECGMGHMLFLQCSLGNLGPNCNVDSPYLYWMSIMKKNFANTTFYCKHFLTVFTGKGKKKKITIGKQRMMT